MGECGYNRETVPDKLDELTGDQPDSGASVSPGRPGQGEREGSCVFHPLSVSTPRVIRPSGDGARCGGGIQMT